MGRRGDAFCRRLADTLPPDFFRRDWRFSYRTSAGAPSVPAFTRQLAPGVALADEPGPDSTFGRHRCRLVAAGLVAAGRGAGPAARRAAVLRTLAAAGLDPVALHLDPGNRDVDLRR